MGVSASVISIKWGIVTPTATASIIIAEPAYTVSAASATTNISLSMGI